MSDGMSFQVSHKEMYLALSFSHCKSMVCGFG